jgi:hypothetical protein
MNQKTSRPTASKISVLRQVCNLIPAHLIPKLARAHDSQEHARTFSHWSHVTSLLYAQLSHSLGLNDVCDALQLHSGPLSAIRGATPPSRNGLSHANKTRPAQMGEDLFWGVVDHLGTIAPGFIKGKSWGRLHRFKTAIYAMDSTVIELVANCMDWAQHRRRKAAAKCHLRLNLQSLLPQCVIIDTAGEHDNTRARELCAPVKSGEIVIFDKGYLDFKHLQDLSERGVFWVSRAKDNMVYDLLDRRPVPEGGKILADEEIMTRDGMHARRIVALVEVDGKEREMVFLTNNMQWSAGTVTDLYRCRWEIEVFFKQIKQTLQLADFLGHNANAVRWQVWMALLTYVLLRFLAWQSKWGHSLVRVFTLTRAILWQKIDLAGLLRSYGTAGGSFRFLGQPEQAYLPGL